jgi:hypothetical protein
MSTPKNHHFVSQVHLKNFFNDKEKKIYVYDKLINKHYFKTTTKTLFSESKSNSRFINGEIDHKTLEKDLNDYFEKDFAKNTKLIEDFTKHNQLTNEVENALGYFAKYGVIGNMRTPRHKKSIDDSLFNAFKTISENATDELKAQIEEMFEYKDKVPYSNVLEYSEIADSILNLMGNLIFQVLIPKNEEDFFIIPDFAAATVRAKINEYFNPDIEEIAYIGIPLTSKIYLHFHSEKLFKGKEKPDSRMAYCSSETVTFYNKANLDFSQDKVACENENYLKNFIDKHSAIA